MRKISFVALVAGTVATVTAISASPAAAHAVFVGAPQAVPTNTDQALAMSVPHERDDTTYNVDVAIAMPAGWQPQSCETKATWTCTIGASGDRQVVHYVKASGAPPAEDETFRFAVRVPATVGTFSFPTVQTYNTGEVVRWIDPAGGGEPAPQLRTAAAAAAPTTAAPPTTLAVAPTTPVTAAPPAPTTTAPPAPTIATPTTVTVAAGPAIDTSSSTSTTAGLAPGAATTTSTTAAPDRATDDGGGGSAAIAIVAALVATAGAAGALVMVRRRGRA
jgi:uncharacterized protein YcnI